MHPAFSVIFFTTASGAGFGLFAWLGLMAATGSLPSKLATGAMLVVGAAFAVAGLVVWGFTGGLLSALLHLGGWERPWDSGEVRDLDEAWAAVRADGREVAET